MGKRDAMELARDLNEAARYEKAVHRERASMLLNEADALIREMHAALEPFAEAAAKLDADLMKVAGKVWGDEYQPVGSDVPPMSAFRRARKLIGGDDEG